MPAKQKLKFVDFDLPFILFVKDSLGDRQLEAWVDAFVKNAKPLPHSPYAPAAEKQQHLVLAGGLPVYVPPEPLADHYEVRLNGVIVGIRLLRRVNPHKDPIVMGEVPGDRAGRSSYSSVRVIFDMNDYSTSIHNNFPLFCEMAVCAINRFISHYRVIADRPYVNVVTADVIQSFLVTTEFDDGSSRQQFFGGGSGPINGMGGSIPDSQDASLREALLQPYEPNIDDVLDTNIKNYLDLKDWRLAVIEVSVAFEAWLSRRIRERLIADGVKNPSERFVDKNGFPLSATAIATKLLKSVCGFDFSDTLEYSEWCTHARDIRNEVVHGKLFAVSEVQAVAAYAAVKNAMRVIAANF